MGRSKGGRTWFPDRELRSMSEEAARAAGGILAVRRFGIGHDGAGGRASFRATADSVDGNDIAEGASVFDFRGDVRAKRVKWNS